MAEKAYKRGCRPNANNLLYEVKRLAHSSIKLSKKEMRDLQFEYKTIGVSVDVPIQTTAPLFRASLEAVDSMCCCESILIFQQRSLKRFIKSHRQRESPFHF